MANRRIYLDHSATTPVDSRVAAVMTHALTETFGNASSVHGFGQQARAAVDRARREVASLIDARQNEIVFTSGGTEANNLALKGLSHGEAAHLITSSIEHPSVRGVCEALEQRGWDVTRLPVYENGIVRIDDLKAAITARTLLITIMAANNEIGTLQPIAEIGKVVAAKRSDGQKIWFHTDAVQAAGRVPINVDELGCDLLSMSGHKLYAPKGVGALFVRRGVRLQSQSVGGHQERERRDPWWGDPSFRVIPLGTTEREVRIHHLHIDPRFGQADLDVVLPMRRLTELARDGAVGGAAPRHYSIMGYILDPTVLVEKTAPAIADAMCADHVDAAALVPA